MPHRPLARLRVEEVDAERIGNLLKASGPTAALALVDDFVDGIADSWAVHRSNGLSVRGLRFQVLVRRNVVRGEWIRSICSSCGGTSLPYGFP